MDRPARRFLAPIIDSIAKRTRSENELMVASLLRYNWPGGSDDRSQRIALEWVRLWGPARRGPLAPVCSCAEGRCDICN